MKSRSLIVAAALLLSSTVASAKSSNTNYTGSSQLTGNTVSQGAPCTDSDPHADLCPAPDDQTSLCDCVQITGTYSGTAGPGTLTFTATVDKYEGVAPAAGNGTGCSPEYGIVRITGKKDTETFDFSGAACQGLNGYDTFYGACVMDSSTLFPSGAVASCGGGQTSATSGKVTFKGLAGKAAPPQ